MNAEVFSKGREARRVRRGQPSPSSAGRSSGGLRCALTTHPVPLVMSSFVSAGSEHSPFSQAGDRVEARAKRRDADGDRQSHLEPAGRFWIHSCRVTLCLSPSQLTWEVGGRS